GVTHVYSGRETEWEQQVVGPVGMRLIPLCMQLSQKDSLGDFADAVFRGWLGGIRHSTMPFSRVLLNRALPGCYMPAIGEVTVNISRQRPTTDPRGLMWSGGGGGL